MSGKRALVLGAGGFIGGHLCKRLKQDGHFVHGVDLKINEFADCAADEFTLGDLRDAGFVRSVVNKSFDEIYHLAADMGGAGYVFSGLHDADIMHNSALINLNVAACLSRLKNPARVFYASSACIYPARNQLEPDNPNCRENSAYPAEPDSEYGWEKLFSERIYQSFARQYGIEVRIARYHNVFGPLGTFAGGREKAPAALCRKVALADDGDVIEVWGPGNQTRSFLFIDECIEGTIRLMRSDCREPLNIGSEERISINDLARLIIAISGKKLVVRNVDGPLGVMGRNSDNTNIQKHLGWRPQAPLRQGLERTYAWIAGQMGGSSRD